MKHTYTSSGADISGDGLYRYHLWREWRSKDTPKEHWNWLGFKDGAGHECGDPASCVFVMLNPSTGDGQTDDRTIRRCVGFAKRLRFDRLDIINLYAYRTKSPKVLFSMLKAGDPIGLRNHEAFRKTIDKPGIVIAGWGAHDMASEQVEDAAFWIQECDVDKIYCLGKTKHGHPKHPLYLKADAPLQVWRAF